jgi:tRNA-5-taurinomethyluridine 2-sulfurtransferase
MKIAMLISGGVDSSVALRLLHEQGHDITAFYLKIWLEDELAHLGECPWEEDLAIIREVCAQINVPVEVVPLQRAYWDRVVSYTINEIKAGRTPNPDLLCNEQVKFGAFYDVIGSKFDKVATGHYAQVEERNGLFHLIASPDPIKDQTYFLALLTQQQLSRAMFPIGHLTKLEVRSLAQKFNLPNKERKDSQGICFLGKLKFSEFVRYHVGSKKGELVEYETGNVMGEHEGFWYYTIGQRHGIGLSGGPWYVVSKDPAKNIVYISKTYHAEDKQRDQLSITNCNWIVGQPIKKNLEVKLRHGPKRIACTLVQNAERSEVWDIKLAEQDQGIAAGQFAVLYDGQECLGGGVII